MDPNYKHLFVKIQKPREIKYSMSTKKPFKNYVKKKSFRLELNFDLDVVKTSR